MLLASLDVDPNHLADLGGEDTAIGAAVNECLESSLQPSARAFYAQLTTIRPIVYQSALVSRVPQPPLW